MPFDVCRPAPLRIPFTPERPLFHLHVPKCGGTSVDTLVLSAFRPGEVWRLELPIGCREWNPAPLRFPCYSGHVPYHLLTRLPPKAAVFTFLRDPIDRAMSAYYFYRQFGRDGLLAQKVMAGLERVCDLPLAEFLRAEPEVAAAYFGNVQTLMLCPTRPDGPLTRDHLTAATRTLERLAFVGLTERFAESVVALCRRFGWPAPDTPPRVNVTPDRPGLAELDPDTRAALAEWTALDAELYRRGAALFEATDWRPPPPPPTTPRAVVALDGPMYGTGWYEAEATDAGPLRWTGRAAWVGVPVAGTGPLRVEVELAGAVQAAQLDGFTVRVSGRPVPLDRTPLGHGLRLTGRVDPGPAGDDGRHRVELVSPYAARPRDVLPGSTDPRELGVAVLRIEVGFESVRTPAPRFTPIDRPSRVIAFRAVDEK